MTPKRFQGIDGLTGRDPVGVVLSVGRKGPTGAPIEKDRFHLMLPQAGGENRAREPHPSFAEFNQAPAENRTVILGTLGNAELPRSFQQERKAMRIKNPKSGKWVAHPNELPVCGGDGKTAKRWRGQDKEAGADRWEQISCPGKLCEFAQYCKPFSKVLFQLRWPDGVTMPSFFARYTSGGWGTADNLVGFVRHLEEVAAGAGFDNPNWLGLPIALTLSEKSRPKLQRRFPVVNFSVVGDPIEFLLWQQRRMQELGSTLALPGGPSVDDEAEQASIAEDLRELHPGIPASQADIVDAEEVEGGDAQGDLFGDAQTRPRLIGKNLEAVKAAAEKAGLGPMDLGDFLFSEEKTAEELQGAKGEDESAFVQRCLDAVQEMANIKAGVRDGAP